MDILNKSLKRNSSFFDIINIDNNKYFLFYTQMVAQVFKMKTKEAGEDSMEVKSIPLSQEQQ